MKKFVWVLISVALGLSFPNLTNVFGAGCVVTSRKFLGEGLGECDEKVKAFISSHSAPCSCFVVDNPSVGLVISLAKHPAESPWFVGNIKGYAKTSEEGCKVAREFQSKLLVEGWDPGIGFQPDCGSRTDGSKGVMVEFIKK